MSDYLASTGRDAMAKAVMYAQSELKADDGAHYDKIIEIDLDKLEPHINGPFTPDLSTPLSNFADKTKQEAWPETLTAGLIGSCTNSSFEDMSRAASLGQQALDAGLKPQMPLLVSPGSEQTRATLEASGILNVFNRLNSTLLTNACGPCCGSWDRQDMEKVCLKNQTHICRANNTQGKKNSIITSYNRNFTGRLDSNPATHIFLASPEIVMAKIFSKDLAFDPMTEAILTKDGAEFRFTPPSGDALPKAGYSNADSVYTPPPTGDRSDISVIISPSSERLQKLAPFQPWTGEDYQDCVVLIKVTGKCTTDHITPAGPWFRYRGHLENISNNTLIGAVNAENGKINTVTNQITGAEHDVPGTARAYKAINQPWVVVADHNYGEGSSREHAALQPRHLGGVAILAKSFARIHEANLKKQGMLALTFANEADYDRINASDRLSIVGLKSFAPGKNLIVRVSPISGNAKSWDCEVEHSFTEEQIGYFKAGSALNVMARERAAALDSSSSGSVEA